MSEWIKVSGRLPEVGDDIFLCWCKERVGSCGYPVVLKFDRELWDILDVTHWTPLPAAPEEE